MKHIEWQARWLFRVITGVALFSLVAYYANVADDYDIWWHLKYGQYFVQHCSWRIDHAQFSWAPADGDWAYVSWLGDAMLYLVHCLAGFAGLNILQWGMFGITVAMFIWYLRRLNMSVTLVSVAGLLLVGIVINPVMVYPKPEMFTLPLFAAVVVIYFVARESNTSHGRSFATGKLFFLYPAIFLLWVNTHGGFVNGLLFITAALGLEWLRTCAKLVCNASGIKYKIVSDPAGKTASPPPTKEGQRTNPATMSTMATMPIARLFHFTFGVMLAYAVTLINPYGIQYWTEVVHQVFIGESHLQSVTAYFPLWQFLLPDGFPFRKVNTAWGLIVMAILWLVLFLYISRQRKYWDWPLLALSLLFFAFGFSVFRASIYYAVFWVFACAQLFAALKRAFVVRLIPAAFVASLLLAGMILYETMRINIYQSWFGSAIEDFIPVAETEFISRNNLPAPLFNDYLTGGYLIWELYPKYKVFIDPRYGPYVSTGVWQDYLGLIKSKSQSALQNFNRNICLIQPLSISDRIML